jgi:hypothetical protein
MLDRPGYIIGVLIGSCLIIFRKRIAEIIIRKQLEDRATPNRMEYRLQLKEAKLEGILYKVIEIAATVFGIVLILMSISKLFPKIDRYILYFLAYAMLTLFAAAVAIVTEVSLLFRFLWKNVRKYVNDRYGLSYQNVQNSYITDIRDAVNKEMANDPVLRALQKRATVNTIICFIPLFIIFVFVFFMIFRLTN